MGQPLTLGPRVVAWMESRLVFGLGAMAGQPLRLRRDQKRTIFEAYEINPDGTRKWNRLTLGRARGWGKTELVAAIGNAELAGPVVFNGFDEQGRPKAKPQINPEVVVIAASFEQAGILFSAATNQLRGVDSPGPLAHQFEFLDKEIRFVDGHPGSLRRVYTSAASLDGKNVSALLADEVHEFTPGNRKDSFVKLRRGLIKRSGAWCFAISTAGERGGGSVAEDEYLLQKRIAAKEIEVPGVKIDWVEAAKGDLNNPKILKAAIEMANPWADAKQREMLAAEYHDPTTTHHAFCRYHLNQWIRGSADNWLAENPGSWSRCYAPDLRLIDRAPAVMGLDLSMKSDTTAAVIAQEVDGRIVVRCKVWFPTAATPIDYNDVIDNIRKTCARYDIFAVAYDPRFFGVTAEMLEAEGLPMVEFPQTRQRLEPAALHTFNQIVHGVIAHDGDRVLREHVGNARAKQSDRGFKLEKPKPDQHIDAAVALTMAVFVLSEAKGEHERARQVRAQTAAEMEDPELKEIMQQIKKEEGTA